MNEQSEIDYNSLEKKHRKPHHHTAHFKECVQEGTQEELKEGQEDEELEEEEEGEVEMEEVKEDDEGIVEHSLASNSLTR